MKTGTTLLALILTGLVGGTAASDLDAVIDGALRGASEAVRERAYQERRYDDRDRYSRDDDERPGGQKKPHPVGHPDGYHCPPGQAKKDRC
jgi:hypothetical protein